MLLKLWKAIFRLLPYQRIPKLPYGMLSAAYDTLTHDERRVLARYGARDPRGVAYLMKRKKAKTVDDLQLKHQKPDNDWERRANHVLCRLTGSTTYDPHRREIARAFRREKHPQEAAEIKARLKRVTGER